MKTYKPLRSIVKGLNDAMNAPKLDRRHFLQMGAGAVGLGTAFAHSGCLRQAETDPAGVDLVWGRRGFSNGRFLTPRAIAIDANDHLYIVDKSARIQSFDVDGEFRNGFSTPLSEHGKPCGLSFNRDGNLLVADTHYFRMLVYQPDGTLLEEQIIGGSNGTGPGQFGFVTDAVQDSDGNYYISEYGECDRVQKFTASGEFIYQFGQHGGEAGQFRRPQSLALDSEGQLWVADACNHRLQVFDVSGKRERFLKQIGENGRAPGQFRFPYGLVIGPDRTLYTSEFGNHRVQKLDPDGNSLDSFGGPGRRPGEFQQPWALALDSQQRLHVLDTYQDRVQRIIL